VTGVCGAFTDVAVKTLLKYDRAFLLDCARCVDARMLQSNWAKLCSQFKDVCLSPQVHIIASMHYVPTSTIDCFLFHYHFAIFISL